MSITTDAGLPAVSSEDFAAALFGSPAPDAEQVAPTEQPAQTETPATPPAQGAEETPAQAATEKPVPDDLATKLAAYEAKLAQLEENEKRREGQYSANVKQQREALEATQRRAEEAERRLTEQSERQAKAAEEDWNSRVAEAQRRIAAETDPSQQSALNQQLRVAIQQHDAEQRLAEANRIAAEAQAKEARLAPVFEQLSGLQQQMAVKSFVDQGLAALTTDGATNLAAETGMPVEEVRAYLQRPQIAERLSRALALTNIAQLTGQPVPTVFQDLGEQIRDHFVDLAAARTQAEAKLIAANQQALVQSGATRGDGGGGGAAPTGKPQNFGQVTKNMWLKALGEAE